jgi:hypothetical protein
VCGSDPDGGQAYDQATNSVYVPCRQGGIQQIDLSTRTVGWKAGQANSTPILVNGDLWAVSYPDGNLQELDPRSGSVMQQVSVGRTVPHFASPAAAGGLLVLGTTRGVVAFGA